MEMPTISKFTLVRPAEGGKDQGKGYRLMGVAEINVLGMFAIKRVYLKFRETADGRTFKFLEFHQVPDKKINKKTGETEQGYCEVVHPISKEVRDHLTIATIEAYEDAMDDWASYHCNEEE